MVFLFCLVKEETYYRPICIQEARSPLDTENLLPTLNVLFHKSQAYTFYQRKIQGKAGREGGLEQTNDRIYGHEMTRPLRCIYECIGLNVEDDTTRGQMTQCGVVQR